MRIGNKTIPDNRLPALIDAVKTLFGKFEFNEIDDDTASRLLGHSTARSGAYKQKIADLRAFGLITPRGSVKVTETGKKVSYPENQQEQNEGLIEAITNVELWKLIYEKYTAKGLELPSDFWTDIRVWTGLPPEEAKNKAEIVKKAYLEDIKYIRPIIKPETEASIMTQTEPTAKVSEFMLTPDIPAQLITSDYGNIKIRNIETIEIARKLLDLIEAKFKAQREEVKKEEKPSP